MHFCCALVSLAVTLGSTATAVVTVGLSGQTHLISILTLFLYSRRGEGWLWAAAGAGIGVYLFYRGFRLLQRKRLILDTPASKIRSASLGLVEVSGLAAGPYTMIAPITGVPCYYVRTIAWQWQQRGRSNEWVKVADESLHVPFFLDDNTGRLMVDPQGAEMDIHCDFHEVFSTALLSGELDIPSTVSTFLARNCIGVEKKLKIEEYCIKPKNSLFILGTLAQNPGLSVTATPVRRVISGEPMVSLHTPLLSSAMSFSMGGRAPVLSLFASVGDEVPLASPNNSPHPTNSVTDPSQQQKITAALVRAGISNPAAWIAAGVDPSPIATAVASGGGAAAPAAALEQFDLHPSVVLMKGAHNPAFFISWRSQREVVKSLGWESALMIWGGPALTLFCTYILALHFDWL